MSSVETTILLERLDFFEASIVYSMSGFPSKGIIFLFFTPLLPPRAGITIRMFKQAHLDDALSYSRQTIGVLNHLAF